MRQAGGRKAGRPAVSVLYEAGNASEAGVSVIHRWSLPDQIFHS